MQATIFLKSGSAEGEAQTGVTWPVPSILRLAGPEVVLSTEAFFNTTIRNGHTRLAYWAALRQFFTWCEGRALGLNEILPRLVAEYFGELSTAGISSATSRQHLSALRRFFDVLQVNALVPLNPVAPVHLVSFGAAGGTTPEIGVGDARKLLASIDVSHVVGLRDLAVLATLVYTAVRAGAVSRLRREDLREMEGQWILHFTEKRGRLLDIPVRQGLLKILHAYLDGAALRDASAETPLFRSADGRTQTLTEKPFHANDICKMMKRRLRDSGLPPHLSPHSIRVTTITDLLAQGVPLYDVQHLAGHADPRTTALYDRNPRNVAEAVVDKISI
jgi:site-specific recombinase XerD